MTPQPCASNLARLLKVRCRSCLMPQQADLAQRRIGRGSIPSACKSHRVSKEAREANLPLFHRTPGRQTTSASHVASQSVQAVTTARRRYLLKLKHRLEPAARSEKQQKTKPRNVFKMQPLLAEHPATPFLLTGQALMAVLKLPTCLRQACTDGRSTSAWPVMGGGRWRVRDNR